MTKQIFLIVQDNCVFRGKEGGTREKGEMRIMNETEQPLWNQAHAHQSETISNERARN